MRLTKILSSSWYECLGWWEQRELSWDNGSFPLSTSLSTKFFSLNLHFQAYLWGSYVAQLCGSQESNFSKFEAKSNSFESSNFCSQYFACFACRFRRPHVRHFNWIAQWRGSIDRTDCWGTQAHPIESNFCFGYADCDLDCGIFLSVQEENGLIPGWIHLKIFKGHSSSRFIIS